LVERPTRIHQDSQIVNENQTRNSGYNTVAAVAGHALKVM
jgi:hypothetical protein